MERKGGGRIGKIKTPRKKIAVEFIVDCNIVMVEYAKKLVHSFKRHNLEINIMILSKMPMLFFFVCYLTF
jgi:hypothetical protein